MKQLERCLSREFSLMPGCDSKSVKTDTKTSATTQSVLVVMDVTSSSVVATVSLFAQPRVDKQRASLGPLEQSRAGPPRFGCHVTVDNCKIKLTKL